MSPCQILHKCLIILFYFSTTSVSQNRNRDRGYRDRDNGYYDDFRHHKVSSNQNARQSVDPCNPNYHRVINEPKRSYNYRFGSGNPREHALCDRDLVPGWYRFQSLAGDTLPTSCPGVNYCGTRAPVWMKGTIPTVAAGPTKATACVSVQGKCCMTQIPILVRNCSDFIVYHLQPTPACPSAYCAGYEVPCPKGLSSDNGYTPCHFPVDLVETKVSYGLSKDGTQLQFFCDVTLGGQVVPETVGLEVEWLADDEIIQSETFGLLQQHKGVLKEEKWSVGQTLQCRARAKHMTINTFTSPMLSAPLNTGITVLSPQTFSVTEGAEPAFIEFQTTIPILCPKKEKPKKTEKNKEKKEEEEEEEETCCVTFEINTRTSSASAPRCASGNPFDLVVTNICAYKVCADEWNSTHKIPIWGVSDGLFGGGQSDEGENHAAVTVEIRTAESSPPRWQEILLPPQEVEILQADIAETCVSGLHLRTFDGIRYENNFEGTFILYKHSTLPYEVQVHRKTCTYSKYCNCGVAVRFGEVMIAADICTTGKMRFWSYTVDGSYIDPAKIAHLPQIIRLDEGRSLQIQFPTGTRVFLGPNLRTIMIQASASDVEHTAGLCGSFDRDASNEFSTYKGQIVCQAHTNRTNSCADFSKSWRLLTEQSLFVGSFTNDGHTEDDETNLDNALSHGHCSCSGLKKSSDVELRPKAKSAYSSPYEDYTPQETEQTEEEAAEANKCTTSPCVDPRGVDITNQLIDLLSEEDFLYEGDEFGTEASLATLQPVFFAQSGLNLNLDTKDGVTEDAAEVFCRGMIEGMPVTKLCRDIAHVDVESHIKYCKEEVVYTKSIVWTLDILEELRMDCKFQVYHNLTTWEPQLGRQHGTPPLGILSSLCLNTCSDSGVCEHGVCRCKKGYSGADCSVSLTVPPKVTGLGFKSTCDIRSKACSEVIVWGERFAEESTIKCHFDVYRTNSVKSVPTLSNTLTTSGKLLTYQSIICDVPDLPVHDAKIASFYIPGEGLEKTRALLRVKISYGTVSSASDPVDYTIFDSLCWACETPLTCEARPTQSCNVLSEPFGTSSDPFQSIPSFSNPSIGFAQSNSPLQYSPDSSFGFSPSAIQHYPSAPVGQPHPGLHNPCTLSKDTGPCRNDDLRYFFDSNIGKCRPFIYGGCQGNSNNFLSEEDCMNSCGSPKDEIANSSPGNSSVLPEGSPSDSLGQRLTLSGSGVKDQPTKKLPDSCLLGNSPGPCDDEVVRYYFDTVMKRCRPFLYSGCLGNANNYVTKEECKTKCEIS